MKNRDLRPSPRLLLSLAGLFTVLLAALPAAADFTASDWRYVKPIVLPVDLDGEGLVEILPDAEVFGASSPGLVDLRIVADDGTEVPYKLEVARGERERESLLAAMQDHGYVAGSHTSFIADLGTAGVMHNELEIRTPAKDFRREVVIDASNDRTTWATIAEQEIYSFSVDERVAASNTRVRYPESAARFLRARIEDDGDGRFEVTGVAVHFDKETPSREIQWPAPLLDVTTQPDQGLTIVEADLGTPGLPNHRVALDVPDVNFYRQVDVAARATDSDDEPWRTLVSRAAVHSIDTPSYTGKSLAITYPETTNRYLRIVIHDEDNPPLDVRAVEVWGIQRRLLFLADPAKSYELHYGNDDATRPSYDVERVFIYLETESPPRATLGPQSDNPLFEEEPPPPAPPVPVTERMPWLLPLAVSAAAVVVGLILFGVFRQARKVLPPPEE